MSQTRKTSLYLDVEVTDPYHTSDSQSDRPGTIAVSRTIGGTRQSLSREFRDKTEYKDTYRQLLNEMFEHIIGEKF